MISSDLSRFLSPVPHSIRVWGTGELTGKPSFPPYVFTHWGTGELNDKQGLADPRQRAFLGQVGARTAFSRKGIQTVCFVEVPQFPTCFAELEARA
jgi:hypothetical protein